MYKTFGDIRKDLSSINLDGKTTIQKSNHEILSNWIKPFDNDAAVSPKNNREFTKRIKAIKKQVIKMNEITKSKIVAFHEVFSDFLFPLYWRWQDEKEYEDWDDYVKVMKTKFDSLIIEKQMTNAVYYSCGKRPFGIRFDFEGFRVTLYANSTHYGWKSKQL